MTHAKLALGTVAATLLVAAGAACSSMAESLGADGSDRAAPGANGSSGSSDGEKAGAAPSTATGAPTATGVLLVHAAAFPSFRLCFENLPNQVPQPDSKVMPEANVVGVEIGSLVRIDPLVAPGKVYVIAESEVRSTAGDPSGVTCKERLATGANKTPRSLTKDNDYHVATEITEPLGENHVSVLAITGCGSNAFLQDLGVSSANCGTDWNTTSGNLKAKVVDLKTTAEGATDTTLPVQLFHMSPAIEAFKGAGGKLEVTFGELGAGKASQPVSTGPIFSGGGQETLNLDQSQQSVYGAYGFHVNVTSLGEPFAIEQSLAAVQELSSPRELPTSYYRVASNYALLLLGDPTHKPTLVGGGANPDYNPRQAVHLLAVPVLDPEKIDAGTDSGATSTAGDGGS